MPRFLIYLFPALMDVVMGAMLLVSGLRMAGAKLSATRVTAAFATWGAAYTIFCPVVARLVTPRNAAWMLVGSSAVIAATAGAFVLFPSLWTVYVLIAVQSAAAAFFFTPFQVFMKQVEGGGSHGIVRSTALYTVAWSTGFAIGPLVAGYIMELAGWQWCYGLNAVLCGVVIVGVLALRHHAHGHRSRAVAERDARSAVGRIDYEALPDLMWVAWVAIGTLILAGAMFRGLFPRTGEVFGIPQHLQGIVIALVAAGQALVALFLVRSRTWMYRAAPLAAFTLVGAAGLVVVACTHQILALCAAALCLGVSGGAGFFYLVFHALVHPSRSARYVGVNETLVGVGCTVGAIFAGLLADGATRWLSVGDALRVPYLTAAALFAAVAVFQFIVHRRHEPALDKAIR